MDERETLDHRRRTGQTLAEFAITLPILLLLLFGIIEFGRIFQAWVTLQNAARAAARYATTGVYDTDKYKLDLNVYDPTNPDWYGDLDSIVPCLKNEPTDDPGESDADKAAAKVYNLAQRGTVEDFYPNDSTDPADKIEIYHNGPESIYATYYSGDDCDPTDPEDQNRRKDLARILSIYDQARIGASGLALGPQIPPTPKVGLPAGWTYDPSTWDPADNYPDPSTVPWYQVWFRPLPGDDDGNPATPPEYYHLTHSNERSWFDVTVCSSRGLQDDKDTRNNTGVIPGDGRFTFPTILDFEP